MTTKEAIERIKIHKEIHKLAEPQSHYINIALDMAIAALKFQTDRQENKDKVERYGKWITSTDGVGNLYYACSNCNASWWEDKTEDRYCSNCGAKMVDMR